MALETSPTAAAGVLSSPTLMSARTADVGKARESRRRHRLRTAAMVLGLPAAFLWFRLLTGDPFNVFALPDK